MPAILERLDEDECWRLVGSCAFGRLGFVAGTQVRIVPAHYRLEERTVYVRASSFGDVVRQANRQPTSLQVDEIDDVDRSGWSVLLSGVAHRVQDAATLARLWPAERDHPWAPGRETQWIAVDIDGVEGRRVSARPGRQGQQVHHLVPSECDQRRIIR